MKNSHEQKIRPVHAVQKILSPFSYWLNKDVKDPGFGMTTTTHVQCSCGRVFATTDFPQHLSSHNIHVRHHLAATCHSAFRTYYACSCGFASDYDTLVSHIAEAQCSQLEDMSQQASKLNDAFDSLSKALRDLGEQFGVSADLLADLPAQVVADAIGAEQSSATTSQKNISKTL